MKSVLNALERLGPNEGFNSTDIDGVTLYKTAKSQSRIPLSYSQGIVFVLHGSESVYFGEQKFIYDVHNYLVLPVPIIAECEVEATPAEPFFALMLDIDLDMLEGIVHQLRKTEALIQMDFQQTIRGMFVSSFSPSIKDSVHRLLAILSDPVMCEVLGRQMVREILFRVFIQNNGREFYSLTAKEAALSRVDTALKWMHQHFDQNISIPELASMVHMGESTFHRVFKSITKQSPAQYLKKLRLHHAKTLISVNGYQVQQAALASGYNSTTQFAREFKRFYGNSPSHFV